MKKAGKRMNIRFNPKKEPKIFRLRELVQNNNGNMSMYIAYVVKCMYEGIERNNKSYVAGINKDYVKQTDYEVFGFYLADSIREIVETLSEKAACSSSAVVKKAIEWYVEETTSEYVKTENELSDVIFSTILNINSNSERKETYENIGQENNVQGVDKETVKERKYLSNDKKTESSEHITKKKVENDPAEELFNNLLNW